METAMMGCNRCDFRGDDLSEHALESGHLLCIVCGRRSLSEREPMTCAKCVARVRADLADILDGYALLEPTSVDALTLLGDGTMQRHARVEELASNVRDEWPNDPLPILAALESWEDFIREDLGIEQGGPDPTLSSVIDWLMTNLDSSHAIAQRFPAFDEFAMAVRQHRSAVQHTAGLAADPVRAPATCPDCEGQLIRTYRPLKEAVAFRREGRDDEGLSDDWSCVECRAIVNRQDYAFRVAYTADAATWVPIAVAAEMSSRPAGLLRIWVHRGHVDSERRANGLHVWWPHVRDKAKPQAS